jgi:hypothetical protein
MLPHPHFPFPSFPAVHGVQSVYGCIPTHCETNMVYHIDQPETLRAPASKKLGFLGLRQLVLWRVVKSTKESYVLLKVSCLYFPDDCC